MLVVKSHFYRRVIKCESVQVIDMRNFFKKIRLDSNGRFSCLSDNARNIELLTPGITELLRKSLLNEMLSVYVFVMNCSCEKVL